MTILVVDDARVMRNIIKNSITENYNGNVDFIETKNGEEALIELEVKKIDIVCLDWNMPQSNGLEFLKRVRSKETYKDLPIIMITSEAAKYMIVEAVEAGITDYIVKPIVGKNLWNKLKDYF